MGVCHTKEKTSQKPLDLTKIYERRKSLKSYSFSKVDLVASKQTYFEDVYDLEEDILGNSGHSQVRRARHKKTGEIRAVKIFKIKNIQAAELKSMMNEINVLKSLDHPNVVRIIEVFDSDFRIVAVMEYIKGKKIIDYLLDLKDFDEKLVATLMYDLFAGLAFLHAHGIIHGKICPDNIICGKDRLKIVDFGHTRQTGISQSVMETSTKMLVDDFIFEAPELLEGRVSPFCDVYSAGIMMYILFTGEMPYENRRKFLSEEKFQFKTPVELMNVSELCKDLLTGILVPVEKRMDAKHVLQHMWFRNTKVGKPLPSKQIVDNLRQYNIKHKLQEAIYLYLVANVVDFSAHQDIVDAFSEIDENKNGMISLEEMQKAMRGIKAPAEVERLFRAVDVTNRGEISFTEYFAAAVNKHEVLMEENIIRVFKMFDLDHSGKISIEEFQNVFANKELSKAEWAELIRDVDLNGDGEV